MEGQTQLLPAGQREKRQQSHSHARTVLVLFVVQNETRHRFQIPFLASRLVADESVRVITLLATSRGLHMLLSISEAVASEQEERKR